MWRSLMPACRVRAAIFSLPKAGTNLVARYLVELIGLKEARFNLDNTLPAKFGKRDISIADSILVGIDDPRPVHRADLERMLLRLRLGSFVSGHPPYSPILESILEQGAYRGILVLRDPRDVVISHAHFVLNTKSHYLHAYYRSLPNFSSCIDTSMLGFVDTDTGLRLRSILDRTNDILGWNRSKEFVLVKFEEIIGPKGGGSATAQGTELAKIAEHLGVGVSATDIRRAADRTFGHSGTFRQGQISAWKRELCGPQLELFNEVAGDLLTRLGYGEDGC